MPVPLARSVRPDRVSVGEVVDAGAGEPPTHQCDPPGRWRRRRLGLRSGAVWRCECGERWILATYRSGPEEDDVRTDWISAAHVRRSYEPGRYALHRLVALRYGAAALATLLEDQ